MNRRTALLALLCAAVLVVVAPGAAYAYWVTSTQTALAAGSATFAISAPASVSGTTNTLAASAADLSGFSGATVSSAVYTNTGAAPWAQLKVTPTSSTSFAGGAVTTYRVAAVATTAACPSDPSAYVSAAAGSAAVPAAVAPGTSIKVCVSTSYAQLSVPNRATTAAMQFTVASQLGNWEAASTAVTVTTTAPNAGLLRCSDRNGANATLTFVAPTTGTYRWIDLATGNGQSFSAASEQSKSLSTDTWFSGTTGTIPVRVERLDGNAWTEIARGNVVGVASWFGFVVNYGCA
ncbi:hypothetical protein [Microbacterium sp.]|uniref:hypothetical protein n=1 Tax=Microbacterium sp. TaxID=51671 RepID=UPI00289E958E|nr:hypothetical protein [Microbacterium sp.]